MQEDQSKRKFKVKIHGFSCWEIRDGDLIVFHEPEGVTYHGMGKEWIHGLNEVYTQVSGMLTMMGVLLDLYGHKGVQVFLHELTWFVQNAPERIGKKLQEAGGKK